MIGGSFALIILGKSQSVQLPNHVHVGSGVLSNPAAVFIAALPVACILALVRRHFQRAAYRTALPKSSGNQAPGYGTGIMAMPQTSQERIIKAKVREWGTTHPNDASLAVALFDESGNVTLKIYPTIAENPESLWSGTIGAVPPVGRPNAKSEEIEEPIKALVRQFLDSGSRVA